MQEAWSLLAAARATADLAISVGTDEADIAAALRRRCVGTLYYALFDLIRAALADHVVGSAREPHSHPGWTKAFRAVEHAALARAHKALTTSQDPGHGLVMVLNALNAARLAREGADYAPGWMIQEEELEQLYLDIEFAMGLFDDIRGDRTVIGLLAVETLLRDRR